MHTHMILLRTAQVAFTILVLGFAGYGRSLRQPPSIIANSSTTVSHWWNSFYHELAPGAVGFQLFSGTWTLLALGWHVYVRNAPGRTIRWATVALDAVCAIIWFAGFVALAAFLGSRVCFGNVCNVARGAAAVSAMQWYVFSPFLLWD